MNHRVIAAATIAAFTWCGAVLAGSPELTSVAFPEKQSVDLVFTTMPTAPAKAKLKGSVKYEAGQAKVSLSFSKMEPAVLFGGDIAAYVVWAIDQSAPPQNLGELIVTKKSQSGSQDFFSPKKNFALMVTAEPFYLVAQPTEIVLFTSAPKDPKKTPGTTFIFQAFRTDRKSVV